LRVRSRRAWGPTGAWDAQVEIACGGVVVHPGDIVVATGDGVAVIPRANLVEVVAGVHAVSKKKADIRVRMRKGRAGRRHHRDARPDLSEVKGVADGRDLARPGRTDGGNVPIASGILEVTHVTMILVRLAAVVLVIALLSSAPAPWSGPVQPAGRERVRGREYEDIFKKTLKEPFERQFNARIIFDPTGSASETTPRSGPHAAIPGGTSL
jgi:hypothetical protein